MTLPDPPYTYHAHVVSVHDGDTITAAVDVGFRATITMALRLDGIDAPELATQAGRDALAWLAPRLPTGTLVLIRTVKDRTEKYGRMLATVYTDDGQPSLNDQLVAAGHAVPYDGGRRTA